MNRPAIKEIKARIDAASELYRSPSHATDDGRHDSYVFDKNVLGKQIAKFTTQNHKNDAIFYFNARTDLPECIAYIEWLEEELDSLDVYKANDIKSILAERALKRKQQ